jgi:hypothetical protein
MDENVIKEKIRIDIKEIKPKHKSDVMTSDAGLKVMHTRSKQPVSNKFCFVPKILPSLREYVEEVRWNSVEKRLYVKIQETPTFSAYQWFGGINERQTNLAEIELDADVVYLSFLDECDREVARFKFSGITLVYHDCILSRDETFGELMGIVDISASPFVGHTLELSYKKSELIKQDQTIDQKGIDEEWKTVEIP